METTSIKTENSRTNEPHKFTLFGKVRLNKFE